jgi:4-hydroxy-3-methylbut-2-en-1-yl diphosphate reductase
MCAMPRRSFDVPPFYRSEAISALKRLRAERDAKHQDLSPSVLDFGALHILLARHFGFCFGVENAIEIAYRALAEEPTRRIFLLSEMIHNPGVNADLQARGVNFLMNTDGTTRVPLEELSAHDVVIVPAFGTTVEIQQELLRRGINPCFYDTTCPFVEKVWRRAADLGARGFSIILHGKRSHEETRATFSHSRLGAPCLIVRDLADARAVADFICGTLSVEEFCERFEGAASSGFAPVEHLQRIGVVNQTTMLATETQEIAHVLRSALGDRFGEARLNEHFADTRDTLCYATYQNQGATRALLEQTLDLAIVVGGYNSSNTCHLVELCAERTRTYFIKDADEILDGDRIRHFDLKTRTVVTTSDWLPKSEPVTIALTSGASCPDSTIELVIESLRGFFPEAPSLGAAVSEFRREARV